MITPPTRRKACKPPLCVLIHFTAGIQPISTGVKSRLQPLRTGGLQSHHIKARGR